MNLLNTLSLQKEQIKKKKNPQLSLEIHSCVNRKPFPSGKCCFECTSQRVIRRLIMVLVMSLFRDCLLWAQYWFDSTNESGYSNVSCSHLCSLVSVCTCKWAVMSSSYAQGCCWDRATRRKMLMLWPLCIAGVLCDAVFSTWSLFPAASPLCLHSVSVVRPPWGGVLKQRRKRKRQEAQPAQSLPQNLLAHLRGWGVVRKGTSITSLSYFLGCNSYECIKVLWEICFASLS